MNKAGGIWFTLPVIWKVILGNIPLQIAQIIAFLGITVCIANIMLIYVALTICRVLVNCECSWFTSLDKQIVTKTVFLSSMIIVVVIRTILVFTKDIKENEIHLGYVIYLSSLDDKQSFEWKYPIFRLLSLAILVIIIFLIELCIGIKIKKLPWSSFKSVALGHVFLMGIVLIALGNKYQKMFYSIQLSLVILSLQVLFALKYRTHIIKVLKGFCCNTTTNSVAPEQPDPELNDFGIFVGPQRILFNNFITPNFVENFSNNPDEPDIVGEVINRPSLPVMVGEVLNNPCLPDMVGEVMNNPSLPDKVGEVMNNSSLPNTVREYTRNPDASSIIGEVINNPSLLNVVEELINTLREPNLVGEYINNPDVQIISNIGEPNHDVEVFNNPSGPSLVRELINNDCAIADVSDTLDIENVYLDFGGVYIGTPENSVHSFTERKIAVRTFSDKKW